MRRNTTNWIRWIISLLILSAIIIFVNPIKVFEKLRSFSPIYLVPSIVLYILGFYISSINLKIFTDAYKKIRLRKLIKQTLISWSLGTISIGKIGEFSIIYFLRKDGLSTGNSTAISILDRIITFIALIIIAIPGILIILARDQIISTIIISSLIISASVFLFSKTGRKMIKKIVPKNITRRFSGFGKTIPDIHKSGWWRMPLNLLLTITKWSINGSILFFILLGHNIHISLFTAIMINSLGSLISLLPISVSGLGIRETAMVWLLSRLSIPGETTLSVMSLLLIITYAFTGTILLLTQKEIKVLRINNPKKTLL